jgi:hypothetical protein
MAVDGPQAPSVVVVVVVVVFDSSPRLVSSV